MPQCSKCGTQVKKLTAHAETKEKMCLKCLTGSGYFALQDHEIVGEDERRGSVRIPLTVTMDFSLSGTGDTDKQDYGAYTVDISMSGLCFVWDSCGTCGTCRGYKPHGVDEKCVFYPYYVNNPSPRALQLALNISEHHSLKLEAHAIYTVKEETLDLEYAGVKFVNVQRQSRRTLEKIIIKYGSA